MFYKLALCLAASLCLAGTVTYSQTVDSAIDKLTNFPSKLFSRINGQTASLNQQLSQQTEKYLQRMARKETRLRAQLYKTDSAKAAALYPNDPQQQYAALIQKFKQDSSRDDGKVQPVAQEATTFGSLWVSREERMTSDQRTPKGECLGD